MVNLPIIAFNKTKAKPPYNNGINEKWLLTEVLKLNNHLTVPCKVLKIIKEEVVDNNNNTLIQYYASVEDCLDMHEWELLQNGWVLGVISSIEYETT